MALKLCIDWDDTLVVADSQVWLPGAHEALRALLQRKAQITIHSSRASWDGGRAQIAAQLGEHLAARVRIEAKPHADWYIDNRAIVFDGDWSPILARLRQAS